MRRSIGLTRPETGQVADGDEEDRLNFEAISYEDSYGRAQPAFEMTQTGFVLLAFGFTGKTALQFKKAYIARFNAMEAELWGPNCPPP